MAAILSDILFLLVYHLVGYRRKVTRANLRNAYPEKTDSERKDLERQYYRHMCDLLIEGAHMLVASPKSILRHYRVTNRQMVNQYYEQGQSVILMSSHYNNWEYMVASLNFQLLHHGVGVGKPLNDRAAQFISRRRIRYGTQVVDHTNVREVMDYYHRHRVPTAYMMLSDQSPSNERKSYWTLFLNQETPFLYGAEHFARKYNYPVLYYSVRKVKRFHYEITFSTLCRQPQTEPPYEITRRYVGLLGQTIDQAPQYWLWSHKRWKRRRPADMPLHAPLPTPPTTL